MEVALLPAPSGHCPVCAGTLAEGRVVGCARCDTAHHQDCIEYGGGCAVYACGSHAYRRETRLEWVAHPAAASTELAKPRMVDLEEVQTLARPVLRVESRRAGRSRIAAVAASMAGFGVFAALLSTISPGNHPLLLLWIRFLREMLGVGSYSGVLLGLIIAALGYFTLSWSVHASLYGLGFLFHRADTSEYLLDREALRLERRASVFGVACGTRSYRFSSIRGVRLIATPGTEVVRLEVAFDGWSQVLADDSKTYFFGYHWTELARLGQRLASELEVPFEWLLPWTPTPGQKLVPEKPLLEKLL